MTSTKYGTPVRAATLFGISDVTFCPSCLVRTKRRHFMCTKVLKRAIDKAAIYIQNAETWKWYKIINKSCASVLLDHKTTALPGWSSNYFQSDILLFKDDSTAVKSPELSPKRCYLLFIDFVLRRNRIINVKLRFTYCVFIRFGFYFAHFMHIISSGKCLWTFVIIIQLRLQLY